MVIGKGKLHLHVLWISLLCFCLMIFTGCSASKESAADFNYASPREHSIMDDGGGDYYEESGSATEDQSSPQAVTRYLIRTGSLHLLVPDTRKAVEQIEKMTADSSGLVSHSSVYEHHEGHYSASLTLRVPEKQFDNFMIRLQDLGEAENVQKGSEDVTLPYMDMEARIKSLKTEEERLREILDMAHNLEEVLQVERELSRVRGEIELMTMKFTHLQDLVSLSTIELYINEKTAGSEKISPKPFDNLGMRLKDALFSSINFISSATAFTLIALTTLLPVLIIITLVVLLVCGIVRAVKKKKRAVPPGGQPPAAN